jgi:hypothetical protein
LKPGPGAYEPKSNLRLLGAFNFKEEKSLYIEEARFKGKEIPTPYDANYSLVEEKTPFPKLIKPKEGPGEKHKIKKSDSPSPASYDAESSYKST